MRSGCLQLLRKLFFILVHTNLSPAVFQKSNSNDYSAIITKRQVLLYCDLFFSLRC